MLLIRIGFFKSPRAVIFQNKTYYRGYPFNCQWIFSKFYSKEKQAENAA
jgi:hypothetical protein